MKIKKQYTVAINNNLLGWRVKMNGIKILGMMKNIKKISLGIMMLFSIINVNASAQNVYVNDMMVLNENEGADIVTIDIKGNGESCKLSLASDDKIYDSSCKMMVNSIGVKIYCTPKKKLCKTYNEIYEFIFNPQSEYLTIEGKIFVASLDSSIEFRDGNMISFLTNSDTGDKIFHSCKNGDYCKISGIINDSFLVSVDTAHKINSPNIVQSEKSVDTPIKVSKVDNPSDEIMINQEYKTKKETNSGENYQVFLLIYFIIMIVTMFKGYGENSTVVIFRDYNDLGLTFLIPVSFFLIFYLFMMLGGNPAWGGVLAFIVSLSLLGLLLKNTYEDNNNNILPTILSFMTKVPLGIIWIISFMTMLNPSSKTAKERRKSRGSALVIMGLLTPIIAMLVVKKEGSLFNPRDWIKGKRIGSIRNNL